MEDINKANKSEQNDTSGEVQDIQKGLKVLYQGEAAYVIAVKPVLVVRTKDRVICGALRKDLGIRKFVN